MLFNSLQFLLFFPIVTTIYFLLPHKFRWAHLLIASCIFYMALIPEYIFILFFVILIDFFAGKMIEKAEGKRRKTLLVASLLANIGILAIFKYYDFFTDNINFILHALSLPTYSVSFLHHLILPVGLSFHTFQSMSYTIEVYRGNQKAEHHLGIYALYVLFYPQLVAGPIERPQNLLHQFREPHAFDSQNLLDGLRLMLWGFFKKLVIGDRLGQYVTIIYGDPTHFHYLNLVIATLFYTIQIYCDFSGYSDIARGAAKSMGFDLMVNFNRPYFAKNIQDFWKRWHISLSTWFKDYVYIPLGGNRVGVKRLYFNSAVVFLISGLWHGANWTFIIWGALHTVYMLTYLFFKRQITFKMPKSIVLDVIYGIFTFSLVAFAWIFFRANTFADALLIVQHIFTLNDLYAFQWVLKDPVNLSEFGLVSLRISVWMTTLMLLLEIPLSVNLTNLNKKPLVDALFCTVILIFIIVFGVFHSNTFIYFQF